MQADAADEFLRDAIEEDASVAAANPAGGSGPTLCIASSGEDDISQAPVDHQLAASDAPAASSEDQAPAVTPADPAEQVRRLITAEFDPQFYLASYPDVRSVASPIAHYLRSGHIEGRSPCSWFDPRFYVQRYPEAQAHALGPFGHYLAVGRDAGLIPSAEFRDYKNLRVRLFVKWLFSRYIRRQYYNPPHRGGLVHKSLLETLLDDAHLDLGSPIPKLDPLIYSRQIGPAGNSWHLLHHYIVHHAVASEPQTSLYDSFSQVMTASSPSYRGLRRAVHRHFYYEYNALSRDEAPDPFEHYFSGGWLDEYDPSAEFSTGFYLEQYADVSQAGLNPLAHFINFGGAEGRRAAPPAFRGSQRTEASLLASMLSRMGQEPASLEKECRADVTVIVPIYRALDQVRALLRSLEDTLAPGQPIVLVDDCSGDDVLSAMLLEWTARRSGAEAILLTENLGFSGACNEGLRRVVSHAVVLNSDTRVSPGWLGRLLAPIDQDQSIASVTPFSNTSSITGFPDHQNESAVYLDLSADELDAIAALLPPQPLYIPTGVGFCLAMSASAIRTLGGFDGETFARGYYEDTDWCQRANDEGFRNVLAPNVFVYHEPGSASFSESSRHELSAKNLHTFVRRHPHFSAEMRAFRRQDPCAPYRKALRIGAWLSKASGIRLLVHHGWGGGVGSSVSSELEAFLKEGGCAIELVAVSEDTYAMTWCFGDERSAFDRVPRSQTLEILELLPLKSVDIHATHNMLDPAATIGEILQRLSGRAYVRFFLHDFLAVCPSQHLLDWKGRYCGIPEVSRCGACLPRNRFASAYAPSIPEWRRGWSAALQQVDEVVIFDESAAEVLQAAFSATTLPPVRLAPHSQPAPAGPRYRPRYTLSYIGFVGSIWHHKGAVEIQAICEYVAHWRPDIHLTLVGEWLEGAPPPNLHVTGRYESKELAKHLDDLDIDLVVFTSVCPETFSFTLSEVFAMGMPCLGLNIGAQGNRLASYVNGATTPSLNPPLVLDAAAKLVRRVSQGSP